MVIRLYRHRSLQYVGGSVARSNRRTYESGLQSWNTFRRLMACWEFPASCDSKSFKAWVLIEFVSWWCASEGNLANTIPGKFAEVQYFHRLGVGVQLPATPRPLTGVFRYATCGGNPHSHVEPGRKSVVAVSVSELLADDAIGRSVHC